ncbi:AMP-binding protein [Bordetella genomosp. 11]|uniref:AMP-binding protein n=1 Tax=Bordetella genomosp. 11 TaxID=1416808 RepID=A0A261UDS8_9BORD|nr:AMP-binding protein [Bordetella genomosp. 11]OZI60079.1 AMP-binding protein [Bordetella genomosp. 11]
MAWMDLAGLLAGERPDVRYAHDPMMSHDDFVRDALSAAGALRARGVRHAGLWFEDAALLAVALFACWRAGIVAVLAGDARPASCAAIDRDVGLWLSDQPALPVPPGRHHTLAGLAGSAPPLAPCMLDPRDGGVVLCTSGSSGQPKRIRKQWTQLIAEITALESVWAWSAAPACVLGSVSPQHMYGLPFRVLWPLASGRAIGRRQLAFPEALQQASLPHGTFAWIASPALLKRLGTQLDWDALAGGIAQIFSAGGPLPGTVSDLLDSRLGCRPTEIYGSSETGAVAWRRGDGAWTPLPGAAAGVQDGALWVRSAWLESGDRFQTADAATLDGPGFRLQGRLDRIVKLEEKRIALPGLEERLMEHPHVREARLGMAGTPRLTALVALAPSGIHALRNQGRKAVIDALRAHMAATVEPLGVPRHWRLMRELPWNAQGKLPQDSFAAAATRPRAPVAQLRSATESADGVRELRLGMEVPLDLAHFNGHFAGMPVVPGVAQIEWAMDLARRHLDAALGFHGMEALKFQRLTRPGDTLDLTLTWHPARAKLYFEYRSDGQPCSSGRILAAAAAAGAAS